MNDWRDFEARDIRAMVENGIGRVEGCRLIRSEPCTDATPAPGRGKGKKRKPWEAAPKWKQ